jgi:diketogulonate reductase-like aldo/keto reductase
MNQKEIGAAFTKIFNDPNSGVKREDVFITSKLWVEDFHPDRVNIGLQKGLKDLQLDYLDLFLIHIPVPCVTTPEKGLRAARRTGFALIDTWRVLETCHAQGLVRSIGVSNFPAVLMNDFQNAAKIVPAVNQIERHPYLSQLELVEFHRSLGVALTAYSPLGARGPETAAKFTQICEPIKHPVIKAIAQKYGKTPAQVLIRWSVEAGIPVIPKSSTPARIVENFDVFDFNLDAEDLSQIASMNRNLRLFEQADEGVPVFK